MMNWRKNLYFFLSRFERGDTLNKLNILHQWERFTSEEIAIQQKWLLKDLLLKAYHSTSYYRDVLGKAGVIKHNEVDLGYFANVPILEREVLSSKRIDLISSDLTNDETYWNKTGGSTGEPVRFLQNFEVKDWARATKLLFTEWAGKSLGEKEIVLWGSERDLFTGTIGPKAKLSNFLLNRIFLNSFNMTSQNMRNYINQINKFKPAHILAYAESIYELAKYIESNSLVVHSPVSIMTSAGTLYPHMRNTIEKVFNTTVFNRYGSRELGDVACECPEHKGLHISPLTHYVEIIKSDGQSAGPNEPGEIIVTLLTNFSMPLIRYRTGDIGMWSDEKCSCGRNWPLLKEVSGRQTDVFITKTGERIMPIYFIHLIGVVFNDGYIKKFQIIQEDYNSILLKIVPSSEAAIFNVQFKSQLQEISDKIKLVMGDDCEVDFEFPDNIPSSRSGKYFYTISKVSSCNS